MHKYVFMILLAILPVIWKLRKVCFILIRRWSSDISRRSSNIRRNIKSRTSSIRQWDYSCDQTARIVINPLEEPFSAIFGLNSQENINSFDLFYKQWINTFKNLLRFSDIAGRQIAKQILSIFQLNPVCFRTFEKQVDFVTKFSDEKKGAIANYWKRNEERFFFPTTTNVSLVSIFQKYLYCSF